MAFASGSGRYVPYSGLSSSVVAPPPPPTEAPSVNVNGAEFSHQGNSTYTSSTGQSLQTVPTSNPSVVSNENIVSPATGQWLGAGYTSNGQTVVTVPNANGVATGAYSPANMGPGYTTFSSTGQPYFIATSRGGGSVVAPPAPSAAPNANSSIVPLSSLTVNASNLAVSNIQKVDPYHYAVTLQGVTSLGTPYTVNEQVSIPATYASMIQQNNNTAPDSLIKQMALTNLFSSSFTSNGMPADFNQTVANAFSALGYGAKNLAVNYSGGTLTISGEPPVPLTENNVSALRSYLNPTAIKQFSSGSQTVTAGKLSLTSSDLQRIYNNLYNYYWNLSHGRFSDNQIQQLIANSDANTIMQNSGEYPSTSPKPQGTDQTMAAMAESMNSRRRQVA